MTKTLVSAGQGIDTLRKASRNSINRQKTLLAADAPKQGSPEWLALLDALVIEQSPSVSLTIEQTSRECIYEDGIR